VVAGIYENDRSIALPALLQILAHDYPTKPPNTDPPELEKAGPLNEDVQRAAHPRIAALSCRLLGGRAERRQSCCLPNAASKAIAAQDVGVGIHKVSAGESDFRARV
jgi:hypothetical protein